MLNVGKKGIVPIDAKLVSENELVGAGFKYEGKDIKILFRTDGVIGGKISFADGKKEIKEKLAECVKDKFYPVLDK